MEIMAVIKGLSTLRETCNVNLYSDSKYVIDAIDKGWVYKWEANNWMRTKTHRASNVDLWEQLLVLLDEHNLELHWVKGHAGNPNNERCDKLAVAAYLGDNLIEDEGYIPEEE